LISFVGSGIAHEIILGNLLFGEILALPQVQPYNSAQGLSIQNQDAAHIVAQEKLLIFPPIQAREKKTRELNSDLQAATAAEFSLTRQTQRRVGIEKSADFASARVRCIAFHRQARTILRIL
jgi:hypothetical protein